MLKKTIRKVFVVRMRVFLFHNSLLEPKRQEEKLLLFEGDFVELFFFSKIKQKICPLLY